MTVLRLQTGIIYGPVNSRRLGRSLGINLLPTNRKVCSFDCVYCHYGRTARKTLRLDPADVPSADEVLSAVEQGLDSHPGIDYLTFSGNGEPTIHPHFPEIVSRVRVLRDRLRPEVRLALLSNSSAVHFPAVRESLALLDVPIMKLDAGDEATFACINRPVEGLHLEDIMRGLRDIPSLVVQAVLVGGRTSNIGPEALESWITVLSQIAPIAVQVYSTDRPVADTGVEKVPPATLGQIAQDVERRTGAKVAAYWA